MSTIIVVPDCRKALALISSSFYGFPAENMSVIGITGTNGKTTTSYLIDSILRLSGCKSGMIGTITYRIDGEEITASHTTPESLDLQNFLRKMADRDVSHCVMEVSSHALELDRVLGVSFNTAVFTNLTRDHLDFHKNIANYRKSKEKLFFDYKPASSVINIDDETGKELAEHISKPVLTYGIEHKADIYGVISAMNSDGIRLKVESPAGVFDIKSSMIGRHNAYNILAAIGAAISEGFTKEQIIAGINGFNMVPGRFEPVKEGQPFTVLIDYAHTEDALENALKGVREITKGKIIVVFGCGGDRDKGKRPNMGDVAVRFADIAVITSDNPRSEAPGNIIEEIVAGINCAEDKYKKIVDREEAIKYAIFHAVEGDAVLIAGKGHEDYQLIGDSRIHFDDKEVTIEAIKEKWH